MPDSYDEIEARIQAAIASIPPDQKPNIVKLARDFTVSESRLRARRLVDPTRYGSGRVTVPRR